MRGQNEWTSMKRMTCYVETTGQNPNSSQSAALDQTARDSGTQDAVDGGQRSHPQRRTAVSTAGHPAPLPPAQPLGTGSTAGPDASHHPQSCPLLILDPPGPPEEELRDK